MLIGFFYKFIINFLFKNFLREIIDIYTYLVISLKFAIFSLIYYNELSRLFTWRCSVV
ncbi:hypothetical protein CSC2_12150 [Clostridium zeae]|uniref:Uncharacterized protein n=1 Tax=Clostridium zeae TaxID=2759022 RepID=A0ABQ1E7M5_9CLOT|nr:hypothetical protein CSC2_12150 [Clostridium zeae]